MGTLEPALALYRTLLDSGIPLIVTRDFNSPSQRDWTQESVGRMPQIKYAVEWPASAAVEALGMQDTYRIIHPDPAKNPGVTWTYGYPYPRLNEGETQDRIDFVFASQNINVLDSKIVGPTGTQDADVGVLPFPSDHRGVVSTISLTPVEPPVYVDALRRVVRGDAFSVAYHAPDGEATDRMVIVPENGDRPPTRLCGCHRRKRDTTGGSVSGRATWRAVPTMSC